MKKLFFAILICLFVNACSYDMEEVPVSEELQNGVLKAGAYDNYFDFEKESFDIKDLKGNIIKDFPVPWQLGATIAGVPEEWLDGNISGPYSERLYTRQKGWELVYSNVMQNDPYKYIGLYNRYTGILRFFVYIFAEPGNQGSSSSMWGLSVNKSTSLLHFTKTSARGLEELSKDPSPAYITTAQGSFSDGKFSTKMGLNNAIWYAFEVECAYDDKLTGGSTNFILMGRAVNFTKYTGDVSTIGNIDGTIVGNSPSSNVNLNFQNMFNNSNTDKSVQIGNGAVVNGLGNKIDDGIKKNDSFFKGLWGNVKENASKWLSSGLEAGVKKGIEAIMSQGTSVAADALGGLLNSLVGGGAQQTISKVELSVKLDSKIEMESEQMMVGWADRYLPVPGTSNSSLYNKPLGIWNLKETPSMLVNIFSTETYENQYSSYPINYNYHYNYGLLNNQEIILNPVVSAEFNIRNPKYVLVINGSYSHMIPSLLNSTPFSFFDNNKYYTFNHTAFYSKFYNSPYPYYSWDEATGPKCKLYVSFELVHKQSGDIYTYSKYFDVDMKKGNIYKTRVNRN